MGQMNTAHEGITLLGLGPGDPGLLTRQAWDLISKLPEIYLRTRQHPIVSHFPPDLKIHSFDYLYENGDSFEQIYNRIVSIVLEMSKLSGEVVYAVPGHPFVAEATSPEISRRAKVEGIPVRVIEGLSFIDAIFAALEVDPLPQTVILDGLEIAMAHFPPYPPSAPAIIAQIHSPVIASEVKLTLNALYPDEHGVKLIHGAGSPSIIVESLHLFEIDRSSHINQLTTLYVPPLGERTSFEAFQEVVAHLRAPDGCPWDREQTHQSLRPHLLEEAYELLSALDSDDSDAMQEEFGDLLLQIVLHAQIASEYGKFNMSDIISGINSKIVYRHPHVFKDLELEDVEGVLQNWERLKAAEREAKGQHEVGLLDGVSLALPALAQAEAYQKRAARVGFDWTNLQGVLDKVIEEFNESQQAVNADQRFAEIGDLLFAVVNLARWFEVDAESALREANIRFKNRFSFIEARVRSEGRILEKMTLEEMDALWDQSKIDPNS
jgi:tetrapyrrole methylase family protein/MazG family protein